MESKSSPPRPDALREHFREQSGYCDEYGSPFTARLIERLTVDLEQGGPVAELAVGTSDGTAPALRGGAFTHPRADMVSLRLAGALHAAVLMGRDPALAAVYPRPGVAWDIDAVWPLARALLARDRAWVADFMRSPPQTNETRRSIALLPGFLAFARQCAQPFDLIEIGASAGLNLSWDRFRYRTAGWSWGPEGGVPIDTDWQGPPPALSVVPRIASRSGCDQNPLDISDRDQRLRLRSYIWADQHDRLARFDAAADQAVAANVHVERADAAEWLPRRLAQRPAGRPAVVYHSLFLQYPTREARAAIEAAIRAAGASVTADAPLAWLRLEPEGVLGGPRGSARFLVDMIRWPGAVHRVFAHTDGHARSVTVVDA